MTGKWPLTLYQLCLIIFLTLTAYWHAYGAALSPNGQVQSRGDTLIVAYGTGFVWDDDVHVIQNPDMQDARGLLRIWTTPRAVYYPLTSTVFWIQYRLWGTNPFPYHLLNILIQIINACLFGRILKNLNIPGAWLASVLFAIHPVHVESVAWITELKNLLCGLFFLLAGCSFLNFYDTLKTKSASRDKGIWYLSSLVCFLLSLLSKPASVMFPFILFFYCLWQEKTSPLKTLRLLLPFFLLAGITAAWTIWEQQFHSGAHGAAWNLTLIERGILAGRAVWFYLGKIIWPYPLSFIYPRWTLDAMVFTAYFPLVVLVLVFLNLGFARNETSKMALAALGYFVLMLFPVLGFFNIYYFRYAFVADHFQYLASLGPIALLASLVYQKRVLACFLLGFFWMLTLGGAYRFKNSEILWNRTLQANPAAWLAHNNLGNLLMSRLNFAQAIPHYREAVRHKPDFVEAHTNLGTALTYLNQFEEGIHHFETALELDHSNAEAHNGLGVLLSQSGQSARAIEHFEAALRIKPYFEGARRNLELEFKKETRRDS